jgi:predicted CXXCH cytochrome family protein
VRKIAFCLVVTLLTVITSVTEARNLIEDPHSFEEDECIRCHLQDQNDGGAPLPLVAPVKEICFECHRDFDLSLSHPVDVRPHGIRIPADMPLSEKGHVTCSTCHDIHGAYDTRPGTRSYFLRRQVLGRQFCVICHNRNSTKTNEGHSAVFRRAHFKSNFSTIDTVRPIDPVSLECLSCHDGSVGKLSTVSIGIRTNTASFNGYNKGLHPIWIDYEKVRIRQGELRSTWAMDKRIKLVQGKVSCVSCHNSYSESKCQLVMDNRGSRLCLGCHIK